MMMINWQPTCCEWHGEYAEAVTKDGGVVRLKRAPDIDLWKVCRFGPDNKAMDKDVDGVPAYVDLSEADALALLA